LRIHSARLRDEPESSGDRLGACVRDCGGDLAGSRFQFRRPRYIVRQANGGSLLCVDDPAGESKLDGPPSRIIDAKEAAAIASMILPVSPSSTARRSPTGSST